MIGMDNIPHAHPMHSRPAQKKGGATLLLFPKRVSWPCQGVTYTEKPTPAGRWIRKVLEPESPVAAL